MTTSPIRDSELLDRYASYFRHPHYRADDVICGWAANVKADGYSHVDRDELIQALKYISDLQAEMNTLKSGKPILDGGGKEWVLVPKFPLGEMRPKGGEAFDKTYAAGRFGEEIAEVWKAMLSAAPAFDGEGK